MCRVKLFSLFAILFSLSACSFYDMYEMPEDVYINLNENIFDVYSDVETNDLIDETNVEIVSTNNKINTDILGEYTYTIDYLYKKRKYKYDIIYKIVDTVEPIFINSSNAVTIKIGDDSNLCDNISFGDNYDNAPTCSINGEYNINEVGKYDLEYVIKDASMNEKRKKFSLSVVKEFSKTTSNSKPKYVYINEVLDKYKNDNTSIGIDVSKWQGNVDFEKVKDAGVEFVIMRIGSQREPSEEFSVDSRFKEYYQKAKDAGLKVSVYVYNCAISREDGIKTANWVINELNGDKLDYPIAYDWENWKDFNNYKISIHTLSEAYLAFEDTLKKAGYDSMLYSSKFYLENVWTNYDNSNIWLVHYTDKTDYKKDYMLWQMTSLGKISGITENTVDIDILYKQKLDK